MAVKSIVVYFPWGAGGNLIKNICTLDPEFDFFNQEQFRPDILPNQIDRYRFLLSYYHSTSSTWTNREWSIRAKYRSKYYENNCITHWDPAVATAYECSGLTEEIDRVTDSSPLKMYDRYRIDKGTAKEQLSPWSLSQCRHVFLLPKDLHLITDIYQSKDPDLEHINPNGTAEARRQQAFIINRLMTLRLSDLADQFTAQEQQVYKYTADELFCNDGDQIVKTIVENLQLGIPADMISSIHSAWLRGTRQVYSDYYNKEFP